MDIERLNQQHEAAYGQRVVQDLENEARAAGRMPPYKAPFLARIVASGIGLLLLYWFAHWASPVIVWTAATVAGVCFFVIPGFRRAVLGFFLNIFLLACILMLLSWLFGHPIIRMGNGQPAKPITVSNSHAEQ